MLWLKVFLFTLVAPGTVTVVLPYLLLRNTRAEVAAHAWQWLGVAPLVLGFGIYLWCVKDFAVKGRGTPAPIDAPKQLVVNGLYRFARNPMYIGIIAILLGEAMLFASTKLLFYAGIVFLCFNLFVLLYEEPALRRMFGEAYEQYCARVPRWLPRFFMKFDDQVR
jgi:protein-S-isoprenylcysteine O-methyltransferase Ste14